MYRPTVRYPDVFKEYVDNLFMHTTLDRNQIFRLALFAAAHSIAFHDILRKHKYSDVPLPSPGWRLDDELYWRGNHYASNTTKGKPSDNRTEGKEAPKKEVVKFKESGGIRITLK